MSANIKSLFFFLNLLPSSIRKWLTWGERFTLKFGIEGQVGKSVEINLFSEQKKEEEEVEKNSQVRKKQKKTKNKEINGAVWNNSGQVGKKKKKKNQDLNSLPGLFQTCE